MNFDEIRIRPEGPGRTAALAAWVQGLYSRESRVPVLVGGAAVELYTGGAYVTGDLDFVGDVPGTVATQLWAAGFEKRGRHWVNEEGQVFLEFPSGRLEPGCEPARLLLGKVAVITIRPEDLILDRLKSLVFWKHKEDGLNAFRLLCAQRQNLDLRRLQSRAPEPEVKLALKRLLGLVPKSGRKAGIAQVRRWIEETIS